MRGTILGYESAGGEGVINNDAGERIKFARTEWKGAGEPIAGRQVDYDLADGRAVDIFPVPGTSMLPSFEGQDPGRQAMIFGIISLACAILSFFLGAVGIVTIVIALIFGVKGKNAGRDLPDRTGYYLSVAGLVIVAIAVILGLFALAAFVGVLGVLGSLR